MHDINSKWKLQILWNCLCEDWRLLFSLQERLIEDKKMRFSYLSDRSCKKDELSPFCVTQEDRMRAIGYKLWEAYFNSIESKIS